MTQHTVFAFAATLTVWAVSVPAYAQHHQSETSGATQSDPAHEACIARRQREGLNTRFAVRRCVRPYN